MGAKDTKIAKMEEKVENEFLPDETELFNLEENQDKETLDYLDPNPSMIIESSLKLPHL